MLDYTIPADLQAEIMQNIVRLVRCARWFMRGSYTDIGETVAQFFADVSTLSKRLPSLTVCVRRRPCG